MNSLKQQNCITTPKIIIDYLNQKKEMKDFYNLFPSYKNLIIQAKSKLNSFNNRSVLLKVLKKQLKKNLNEIHPIQQKNLDFLSKTNTVTIVCGNQLNLLTGPIYFLYKILQTIKLSDELNQIQNEINFVPFFWFASEDHDFLEINHFYFKEKKWIWEEENKKDVGSKALNNLLPILEEFIQSINSLPYSEKIISLINESYFKSENLAQATYKLVNLIFASYGLIGIDGNCTELKQLLKPFVEEEFLNYRCCEKVSQTNHKLKKLHYKTQVFPREINLFELNEKERKRIDQVPKEYCIQKISPNVLIRTIYQEKILPNVAYIGGNAEISYWLQLKSYFNHFNIPFPILIPRNSFVIINEKQKKKLIRLGISYWDLLNQTNKTIEELILKKSAISIDFEKYILETKKMYQSMIKESEKTEKTLKNLLLAQEKRQLNQFENLKKRILKAEKKRQKQKINTLENLQKQLFPNGRTQERLVNFIEFYFENPNLLKLLYQEISPIESYYKILKI